MEYRPGTVSSDLVTKIKLRGLLMCVALPLVLFLGVWLLGHSLPVSQNPPTQVLFYIFIAVASLGPIVVFLFLRLSTSRVRSFVLQSAQQGRSPAELIATQCTTLLGAALAPAWIGLAAFLSGSGFVHFSVLIAISLFAYLLLRPKDQEIEDLMREASRMQQSPGNSGS